ncbi:bifunctional [glutamine synthetase] adenylyltransferase/[glutamine synthetase]-adenylyl-L-tyrosine phosphorylase [Tomitella fengzijianii]|uniref:Bifunctional glutamine synthetase adenylyltransferase/adenylyl-removing enzyme n=1 Tax=Tomitella fengzijianii TaxID=2597660 RepID=A0A516X4E1_9ACTN|nr:bifunctional [glutamine synthetase] adenylyltransferase/[glutamine synthetase]-adenylyl-L-tyrosine phosphorylase [Tomitella fengzijianii]QDQ97924.1 bifunctional [glutamine synthetase] adenylyltransferase/[glutamine synthetase]-adenylyl-L-tyrosine phosphorylase [Tomitella fengzijianii]
MPARTSRRRIPSTGRLGLVEAHAAEDLAGLGWTGADDVSVLWALSRAPDAGLALRTLVRMKEALDEQPDEAAPGGDGAVASGPGGWGTLDEALHADSRLRARLLAVIGSSTALGDHLVHFPGTWRHLASMPELPGRDEIQADLLSAVDAVPEGDHGLHRAGVTGPEAVLALRTRYREHLLLLAAVDLAPTIENEPDLEFRAVGRHLSDLADAALTAALAVAVATVSHEEPVEARLAVVALGKCGARELNYVSDVDVVFVAEPADALTARLAGEMIRIGSSAFFEVDAGLRPEGKQGALVRTLDSHLAYYRRWAKTWEFQALLKARPAAGDMDLGREYAAAVGPMVWTASQREDFVPEVRAMRRRVEELVPADVRAREIKLGTGSLRDVEFAVQLLQMVHGRADETLHSKSTLNALAQLSAGGYVGRGDAAQLTESYVFLRLLEHRLQLQRLQRTHMLPPPDDTEALRWLARAAHVRSEARRGVVDELQREIRRHSQHIRRLHAKLFYRPLLESITQIDSDALRLSPQAAERQLAALGYRAPRNALGHLKALTKGATRKGRIQSLMLPTLLEWLGETPDPDAGLLAYRTLSEAMTDHPWFLRTLRDEGALAKRLMLVLGSSRYIPDLLLRAPDVVHMYADGASGPKLLAVDYSVVSQGLIRSAARHRDPERAIAAARSLRRAELARVASADVLGMLEVRQVCRALSSVWVSVLEAALSSVIRAATAETGRPAPARIAVIGMGRLGGGELGYGSDADVLFVCEPIRGEPGTPSPSDAEAVRWASGIADRVRSLLSRASVDPPLEVDADLRPEGRSGPLVRTLASYQAYYRKWAEPWEVQALLRATTVTGDADLGVRFLHMIDEFRYPPGGIDADTVLQIRRMKARVDSERLPRGADPATHTKLGRGGLADIEWTVQLLQLKHAHENPELRGTSTLETLEAIGRIGLLEDEDVHMLTESWLLATRARNAIVLARGKPGDQIPGTGDQLAAVAYAAGWRGDDAGEFLDHYLRVTRRARAVVDRVFG